MSVSASAGVAGTAPVRDPTRLVAIVARLQRRLHALLRGYRVIGRVASSRARSAPLLPAVVDDDADDQQDAGDDEADLQGAHCGITLVYPHTAHEPNTWSFV